MRFLWIGSWGSSLMWLFLRLCLLSVPSLGWLHKWLYEFCEEIFGEGNKRWSKSLKRDRSLVAAGIWSSCWALGAGELILLSNRIGRKIVIRVLSSTRSWSDCNKDLIIIFPNGLIDLLNMELLKLWNRQPSSLAKVFLVDQLRRCSAWIEKSHVLRLRNHNTISEKMCNQFFLKKWESKQYILLCSHVGEM